MRELHFVLAVALLALAACDSLQPAPTNANSPYYRPPTPAEANCDRQGLLRGTNDYNDCLDRQNGAAKPLPPVVTPPAGVEVFRDEYGNRYDGQGNRLDAQGNIIGPPVTRR
jgi:hypothetical protein